MTAELGYFARRGALLLPCLTKADERGKAKDPDTGLMHRTTGSGRFSQGGASGNPALWMEWARIQPGCAFAVWAGGSRLIIVDIDTKIGREKAWQLWHEWCAAHSLPTFMPHVETPSGGWHVYCAVPDGVDATALRQPDLVRVEHNGKPTGVINVRAGNGYVLVPPSVIDSGAYRFFDITRDPYPAPDALLQHCANVDNLQTTLTTPQGGEALFDPSNYTPRDREIARMKFLADAAVFAQAAEGGRNQELNTVAFKHAGSVRAGLLDATEYEHALMDACEQNGLIADDGEEQCLKTILSAIGGAQRKNVNPQAPKPVSVVFAGLDLNAVAQAAPQPMPGANPLFGQTAQIVGDLGGPTVTEATNKLLAGDAIDAAWPMLPAELANHPLYEQMREFLRRFAKTAEVEPHRIKADTFAPTLGVLCAVDETVFNAMLAEIERRGLRFATGKVRSAAIEFANRVQRESRSFGDFIRHTKTGEPESDNPDNVRVLLRMMNCEVRFNMWTEKMEIRGGQWNDWIGVDDPVVARLLAIGGDSQNRFRPGVEFFWRNLDDLARENSFDPARNYLDACEAAYDGLPRIDTWLTTYCQQADTPYLRAVARNVIGGIVKRIREPGCKHDEVMILTGPQGLGKSTLCRALAIQDDWFSDEVLIGEASKELVLSLRGKAVIELSELDGMSKRDAATVKAMLSRQVDRGRPAYGRTVQERPRRCIFIATCNDDTPLQDETGNRRFLPVRLTGRPDIAGLRAVLPQLIGEACARLTAGETFDVPGELWHVTAQHQEAARSQGGAEILMHHAIDSQVSPLEPVFVASATAVRFLQANGVRGKHTGPLRKAGFSEAVVDSGGKSLRGWGRNMPGMSLSGVTVLELSADGKGFIARRPDGQSRATLPGFNIVAFPARPTAELSPPQPDLAMPPFPPPKAPF